MRVLVTNSTLALRGGTEAYVQDLAAALLRAGHEVAAYSNILGEAAVDLRAGGVTVVDHLAAAPWVPDILHGHHNTEAMTALLHFGGVPAVFVSHGWSGWLDAPFLHPRVFRYVAVDGPTRSAMVGRYGVPASQVRLVPNFVDLDRFMPRVPLPDVPRRALVFSHYAREDTHVPVVREACRQLNLHLDVAGYGIGRPIRRPEQVLGQYDIVFAKGRAALEAVAVGNAVVVCDSFGLGPLVTMGNVDVLRTLEGDYMQYYAPLGVEALVREIRRYDAADAAAVTRRVRAVAGADTLVPVLVSLYEEARAEFAARTGDADADARAAATYLRWMSRHVKERMVERDPLAGLAIRLRNRLARVPLLAPLLLRMSATIQKRWPARRSPDHVETVDGAQAGGRPPHRGPRQP
jgi:hypothetical protein